MNPSVSLPRRFFEMLETYHPLLSRIAAADYARRPGPGKWSKKEILGHLVDSAQNNLRRLIVGQYDPGSVIGYVQDEWVRICNYQQWPESEILALWYGLNKQMARVLESMSSESLQKTIAMPGGQQPTLGWIADDYLKHLLHHLHQVAGMDPVPYP